tara:strand:- start:1053 stop:1481 length:429 start_codon:yes stop_codon:yes gene_type:complete
LHLVTKAANWTEHNQALICQLGRALTTGEQSTARKVGVANPERVFVYEVPVIKRPEEPELLALCEEYGFLTEETIGLTLGYGIYIKQGCLTTRLLSHELRHVYQYEQAGSAEAFLSRYIGEIIQFGYQDSPYEVDARKHEIT